MELFFLWIVKIVIYDHLCPQLVQNSRRRFPWNSEFPRVESTATGKVRTYQLGGMKTHHACNGFLSLFWLKRSLTAPLVAPKISSGESLRLPYAFEVNKQAISCPLPPSANGFSWMTRQVPINSSFEWALQWALYTSNASGYLDRKASAIPAPHDPMVLQA